MDHLKVYEAARDYLRDPDKWCQGKLEDGNGARCLGGAIFHASQEQDPVSNSTALFGRHRRALRALGPIIERLDPTYTALPHVHPVPYYNDNHSHAEVLELLNIAIAELQSERAEREAEEPATEREPCLIAA